MFDACYSCYFLQEEHYDCLGETLKDGIAHFPVHNLQLDTEFLQRQQSLDLQANGQLAVHSLMGLVLNDDPPQLEWSSPFPLASSSPGTRQDNVGVVKPHHKEQAQGDRFMFERLSSDSRITARPLCLCISISNVQPSSTYLPLLIVMLTPSLYVVIFLEVPQSMKLGHYS